MRASYRRQVIYNSTAMVAILCCSACTSRPAIVADPPRHTHAPPELVPWEEEYARMRPRPEIFDETVSAEETLGSNGTLVKADEDDSGVFGTVADVFAFPFRGVGWLLEQVF